MTGTSTSRRLRVVTWVVAGVVSLGLLASGLVVFRSSGEFSELLDVSATFWPSQVRVVDVDRRRVTIEEVEDGPTWLTVGERYGLVWETGSGQVGEVLSDEGEQVERSFRLLEGSLPKPETLARYSREGYPRDARRAFPQREVRALVVPGEGNELPAWFVPGDSSTWAILVPGLGAARSETFRMMRSTVAAGLPSLAITYRGAAETGGGRADLGLTEWRDLESAVRLAGSRGADDVVLLGASMGGSVIASFLERSELAGRVSAVALDSPLLDFPTAIEGVVRDTGVPGFLVPATVWATQLRTGLDFEETDHLDDTSWLTVPALVFHGTSDGSVPVASTRRLAEAEPELVTTLLVEGAGHVEAWNVAPRRYDRLLREFLQPHAGG